MKITTNIISIIFLILMYPIGLYAQGNLTGSIYINTTTCCTSVKGICTSDYCRRKPDSTNPSPNLGRCVQEEDFNHNPICACRLGMDNCGNYEHDQGEECDFSVVPDGCESTETEPKICNERCICEKVNLNDNQTNNACNVNCRPCEILEQSSCTCHSTCTTTQYCDLTTNTCKENPVKLFRTLINIFHKRGINK